MSYVSGIVGKKDDPKHRASQLPRLFPTCSTDGGPRHHYFQFPTARTFLADGGPETPLLPMFPMTPPCA
eukprot:7641640-Lingulodinium_polyedra.AAC.1